MLFSSGIRENDPILHLKDVPGEGRVDDLSQRIAKMVLAGDLTPGYTFPNENVLCKHLAVGRSTLREAYTTLSALGYITRNKRGTYVNDQAHIISSTPLNKTLRRSGKSEFVEFRLMLETETAKLAARRASKEDIATFVRINNQLGSELRKDNVDIDKITRLDIDFHMDIAKAAHNILFAETMTSVAQVWAEDIKENFETINQHPLLQKALLQHRLIIDAISDRNEELAIAAMRNHVETNSYYHHGLPRIKVESI